MAGLDFVKDDILRRYEFTLVNQITGVQTSVIEWRNLTQGASLISAPPSEDEFVAYVKSLGTSNLANQKLILGGWDENLSQSFIETRTYDTLGAYTSVFETFDGATWSVYTPALGALIYSDVSVYQSSSTLIDIRTRLTEIKAIQTDGTQKTQIYDPASTEYALVTDGGRLNVRTANSTINIDFLQCVANGAGYSIGDIVERKLITFFINESADSLSTEWINLNTGVPITPLTLDVLPIGAAGVQKTGIWYNTNQMVVNLDGSINTLELIAVKTLVSSIETTNGSVASGSNSVSFVTSNDFVGTINGVARQANSNYSFAASKANILAAIPYTVTSGSLLIDKI